MFRVKESSNRIELSRLVQEVIEFWCFGLPAALGGRGWVDRGGGGWIGMGVVGGSPHTHTHACTCTHTHVCVVNMIISCKWPPPLGESMGIPYDVICTCMHVCMCMCMWTCVGGIPHHPTSSSTHPPPPGGDPRNQSKFNST